MEKKLNNVKIGQTSEEIVLTINVIADVEDVVTELREKLPKLKEMYQEEDLPIRVTGKLFSPSEQNIVRGAIVEELDVSIKFDDVSDLLGLHAIKKTFQNDTEISETKYIPNSLRSGQKEEYTGSLVIFGDVNSGAEIIAGGNISILGTLRGLAHAGANGNTKAVISANTIDITQIRIANMVREVEFKVDKCPICKIKDNNIVIE